jgi:2-C-methyl-D-erythritol 4-phosphate cytidylyltransferase
VNVAVIIVAAGAGHRLGRDVPKAFVPLAGRPLLRHALDGALACAEVGHVVVVAPVTHLTQARGLVAAEETPYVDIVAGGAERTDSVARGLALLRPDDGLVLVHDAARCGAPPELFDRVVAALRGGHGAVVPGLPVVDTIKQVDADGYVVATPERATLRAIQTPQGFVREVLLHAHERAHGWAQERTTDGASESAGGVAVTDDAGLVEACGGRVQVVPGDPRAAKITTPDDLAAAERALAG